MVVLDAVRAASLVEPVGRCESTEPVVRFEIVEQAGGETDGIDDGALARFSFQGQRFVVREKAAGAAPASRPVAKLLTGRERQITELISRGLRNKQIAAELVLSEYTVAAYVKQICQKLEVNNRTAASRWLCERHRLDGA